MYVASALKIKCVLASIKSTKGICYRKLQNFRKDLGLSGRDRDGGTVSIHGTALFETLKYT